MKIFPLSMVAMATAMEGVDLDAIVTDLQADQLDLPSFHQYENTTDVDFEVDYNKLAKEYFEGGSRFVGGNPRARSRAAAGPLSERTKAEDKEFIQRFLQLKYSILFLQKNKRFGRYCFYGCWCLPNGASDLGMGTGPPIDDIDRSCREFATCYNCLYNTEIGRGCDAKNPGRYVIKGRMDAVTKQKYLMCMDPPGSCKRMRCECDRSLAEKLSEYESQWNIQNHRRWGTPAFDQEKYCTVPTTGESEVFADQASEQFSGPGFQGARADGPEGTSGGGGGGGNGGAATSPNQVVSSAPIYGEIVGCCGRSPTLHYFRKGQKCCSDGEVVDENAPCNVDFL